MDVDGVLISVFNMSNLDWQRNNWHVGAGSVEGVNWTDELTQTPSVVIAKGGGSTQGALSSAHLSYFVKDALWMCLGYGSAEGSFAVEVQQLFHMFTLGPQCQWHHWNNGWSDYTTDTTPFVWTFKTCKVVATPSLSSSGGSVSISISNLKPSAPPIITH